ncbi:conserved domain protein [Ruminococcus albus 8]|uniref:Conserved domain protein n=2 Tax=Ruminococcus albus TaxID=1264 RepID=E9SAN5_RUMAL|nr:conserved domain protein [Ruminococcus albus 8]
MSTMKKYAVYKSSAGYYCNEYHDTLETLKGTPFETMVKEEQLPVVLDGKGGYYRFKEDDYNFVKVIESDKKYPLPLEKMFFKNSDSFKLGWMSPQGDTYSCDYYNHNRCAIMLADRFIPGAKFPERALGKAGWIKIIDSWDGMQRQHGQFVYSLTGRITKQQADKLFDIGLYFNEEVQQLIKDCEDDW